MKKKNNLQKKDFELFCLKVWHECFWVQPLLKSRNRAEEFHLLTEELHHRRLWAYFRMSVGVKGTFTDTHLWRHSSSYLSSPNDRQYSAICCLWECSFFVALCASNTTWRWEEQMLWEKRLVLLTGTVIGWCFVCGVTICSVKSTSIRKVKALFFAAWCTHSVWKYSCFSRASHLHELILHLVCTGLHLAVSPRGLCKQHG